MNAKTQKIIAEMERISTRISILQGRYRELERQKTESENTEILELVKKASLTPERLAAFLQSLNGQNAPAPLLFRQGESSHEE